MKIAIVDDEKNVRLSLKTALEKEGFSVMEFANGQTAFESISNHDFPDLYILDIMMPVMDGITLLRKMREMGIKIPVIFLTSRDEEFDKILGLELGADDYLCKPFSVKELIARIHVILRRCSYSKEKEKILKVGNVCLDLLSYEAFINNQKISMTVTEFRILKAFIEHNGEVLSREQLIEIAYPDDIYLNDRAVDCHIKRLRKKIDENYIQTIYGLGYKGNFDA